MERLRALRVARAMARRIGVECMTKNSFCQECGIPPGSLYHRTGLYFHEIIADAKAHAEGVPTDSGAAKRRRMDPPSRRAHIVRTALDLARSHGYTELDRSRVAGAAGISPGTVSRYFENATGLTDEVLRLAIATEDMDVLRQGLAMRHPVAMGAPESLKRRAFYNGNF